MIKVINYCWFGGNPLPELATRCINSWRKYCPEFEIVEWNEHNFDCNACSYIKEAYQMKRWAFVSDFARFWILYNHGGLYFDTDVELIRPIEDIIERGPFMGLEKDINFSIIDNSINRRFQNKKRRIDVAAGLGLYANPGLDIYGEILDSYSKRHFIDNTGKEDTTTVVEIVSEILNKYKLEVVDDITLKLGNIYIYRKDVFCPMDYRTGEMLITENTRSIHHYNASWMTKDELLNQEIFIKEKQRYGKVAGRIVGYIKTIPLRARKKWGKRHIP